MPRCAGIFALLFWALVPAIFAASPANRLTYLDEADPFYAGLEFPKLTAPQWVGESNVEAVVILAIDDMRDPAKYETFLRPILERLKKIDSYGGSPHAPVSIFCNALDPQHPQLQAWLKEGLSLENHTLSHPCPCLAKGDFGAAASTYHGGVDLLARVPNSKPVAFRMPCCDSMNSPSPRFYAEIFNSTNAAGQFLTIDSSVMNIPTSADPSLPRGLVQDREGRSRFEKYFPVETNATTRVTMKSFVTTIRDYPYPYVIGNLCWEFPAMVPSDWEAHNLHGATNPVTVADWKAALDIAVIKQGTFTFIFHPHGWIRADQVTDFIDYAVQKYGQKVKFLTFREAQERIDKHLLAGQSLRDSRGADNGVRLLDLNNDGYQDVLIGNSAVRKCRLWSAQSRSWSDSPLPAVIDVQTRFGVLDGGVVLLRTGTNGSAFRFKNQNWTQNQALLSGLKSPLLASAVRLRDVNKDGQSDLLLANARESAIYSWSSEKRTWQKLAFALPPGVSIVDTNGSDFGLRFVDFNDDGYDDVIYSNADAYGLYLFLPKPKEDWRFEVGWTRKVRAGKRSENDPHAIPMIARGGTRPNNGAWFQSRHLWIQNEDTAHLPDKVDRRPFDQLLAFDSPVPKSPEESLACIKVRPGFKVELVAAEPLVMDPVAFEWGPDGKLWVVEMGDYPVGVDGNGKTGGIVRFLEDTNDDGRHDKSTVFLSELNFPTGVMPWRKGVIVSAAPEVFYAEDRDGDGKADHRVTLLSGFGEGNQQHRVNGFEYGLDNWIYAANGDSGGTIHAIAGVLGSSPRKESVNFRGHDLRFRPDDAIFELIEGQTQFGRHRDDWGNWFGNNNPSWGWHYWIPERYATRNEHLALRSVRQPLANYPNATRVFTISKPLQRFNWPNLVNTLTSGNSVTPYRDELFGTNFENSVWVSEPAHNVVHRENLIATGVTFDSRRPADEPDREFLASTDNWFRPTMLKTGPDGALYAADMYRLVIEHTEYALPGMEKQIDVRAGSDRGRIYRVFPEGTRLRAIPRLDNLDTPGLVAALDSPNGWQRDTAQRTLVHAQDKAAVPSLRKLLASTKNPKARLHALCTLEGLGALELKDLEGAWRDSHPMVRAHAVRLGESMKSSRGFSSMFALAADPDIRVRYQLALTLGEQLWPAKEAGSALATIAARDIDNPQMQAAVMSAAPACLETFVAELESRAAGKRSVLPLREQLLQLATAANRPTAIVALIKSALNNPNSAETFSLVDSFLAALERRQSTLDKFRAQCSGELRDLLQQFDELRTRAEKIGFASAAPENERASAVRLLGRLASSSETTDRFAELLVANHPVPVQKAALAALRSSPQNNSANGVLAKWPQLSPSMRTEVLEMLLGNRTSTEALLSAVATQQLPAGQISATARQRLINNRDEKIRKRAIALFEKVGGDRRQLVRQYRMPGPGNIHQGKTLFTQHCAACHKLKGEGIALGPDLAGLTDKSVDTLLVAILDPNQSVETPFVNYTIVTTDARELSGIIVSETGTSVTLRAAGGAEHVLLRNGIREITSSGLSLMPEGLEQGLTPQQMADLIQYVLSE
jgi:putative membrane-bound dehydrogenase-like protein